MPPVRLSLNLEMTNRRNSYSFAVVDNFDLTDCSDWILLVVDSLADNFDYILVVFDSLASKCFEYFVVFDLNEFDFDFDFFLQKNPKTTRFERSQHMLKQSVSTTTPSSSSLIFTLRLLLAKWVIRALLTHLYEDETSLLKCGNHMC